jgi:NADPH:quinone reductase-like Zn-dependent oxidoreductase
VALREGQLVYVDCVVKARDDPDSLFLSAVIEGFGEGSKKLMREVWRDGAFGEFARMPLENVIPLDEPRLVKELGYSEERLVQIAALMVPFGGLRDLKIEPGETVVASPATGHYSAAGVQVAFAFGARVIAFARSAEKLKVLKEFVQRGDPGARIETVISTGDEDKDAKLLRQFGVVDAVLDLTPSSASDSTFTKSAIKALRRGGRVSLMGATQNIGAAEILTNSITLKGTFVNLIGSIWIAIGC